MRPFGRGVPTKKSHEADFILSHQRLNVSACVVVVGMSQRLVNRLNEGRRQTVIGFFYLEIQNENYNDDECPTAKDVVESHGAFGDESESTDHLNLFLHVGPIKIGSTTLQRFLVGLLSEYLFNRRLHIPSGQSMIR